MGRVPKTSGRAASEIKHQRQEYKSKSEAGAGQAKQSELRRKISLISVVNEMHPRGIVSAGLGRRFLSLIYECVLLFAIAFIASLLFHGAVESELSGWNRHAYQLYLFLVFGLYFHWCWLRGGQTLPMKTWRLRLINTRGEPLGFAQCTLRYLAAWLSLLCFGAGFWWAFFDRDRHFLHDRLARTRVVRVDSY